MSLSNRRIAEIFGEAANAADPLSSMLHQQQGVTFSGSVNLPQSSPEEYAAARLVSRVLRGIAAAYQRVAAEEELP